MNYYKVLFSDDYAKKKRVFGIVESLPDLDDFYFLNDNEKFAFDNIANLKFIFDGIKFADWQMSVYPWRFISKKFKNILEKFIKDDNNVYFHPVSIYDLIDDSIKEEYFILHFDKTISFEEIDKNLFKAKLEMEKFHFQAFSNTISGTFFVSEELKETLINEKITGIAFDQL